MTTKAKNTVEYHKCVDILIFNDSGMLALQMRAANDKSFPGYWDFSAGGHIDLREENQMAAEREILEELGVSGSILFVSQEKLIYLSWNPSILREVDASIYKMIHNGPFIIDSNEVESIEFFSLSAIQKMIDNGSKFHPEFLLVWKKGLVHQSAGR